MQASVLDKYAYKNGQTPEVMRMQFTPEMRQSPCRSIESNNANTKMSQTLSIAMAQGPKRSALKNSPAIPGGQFLHSP